MPGRTFSSELYRYGYQGSERDPEMSGGAGYTTFFRALDPRIGRWLTPDPKVFPWQSPYVSMDGNPVALVDPWGDETLKEVKVTAKDKGPHPKGRGLEPSSVDASVLKPMKQTSLVEKAFVQPMKAAGGALLYAMKLGVSAMVFSHQKGSEAIGIAIEGTQKSLGVETESERRARAYQFYLDSGSDIPWDPPGGMEIHPEFDILFGFRLAYLTRANSVVGKTEKLRSRAVKAKFQVFGKPASSKVLGDNLVASGVNRPVNSAAHHIVAGSDKRAALARSILKRERIDINAAENGVFLPKSSQYANPPSIIHSQIHTNKYYQALNSRLQGASNVRQELGKIRQDILNGTFPY